MPTREEMELKERADRALRGGRAEEAWGLYLDLLGRVSVLEPGLYETWLDGALSAARALGRRLSTGHLLLALRRFDEAERALDRVESPVEWALAVARQARAEDAASALADAGHVAFAAIVLDEAGNRGAALALWQRFLAQPVLRGRPYETALGQVALGRSLRARGEETEARRAFGRAQELLEGLADEFETRGQRERAFDCYGLLLRIGEETDSFENIAEGYLNAIRILVADDHRFYALQYYEDFVEACVARGEWQAAAALAREAGELAQRAALSQSRPWLVRAVDLGRRAAAEAQRQGLPSEVAESALLGALDVAIGLEDLQILGALYAALAALPLPGPVRERYLRLSQRHPALTAPEPDVGTALPDRLRFLSAPQDVVRQDLVEWELGGAPRPVLAQILVERTDHVRFQRLATRALMVLGAPGFTADDARHGAELAAALGRVQVYEVLSPLERLHAQGSPEVRTAAVAAAGQVFCRRSFGLVRSGLQDPEPRVRREALRALRGLRFRDGLEPLVRIFRELDDAEVRRAVVETVADIGTLEAGLFLVEVIKQEPGLRDVASRRLREIANPTLQLVVDEQLAVSSGAVAGAFAAAAQQRGGMAT